MLDKDTSLAEKIPMLFREQGITIVSILMAIRMAIGVLVEELLPGGTAGGGTGSASAVGDNSPPNSPPWHRTRKLGMKVAEAFPGITGVILSWIIYRAADVVACVSQNLWALVIDVAGLLYTYMATKK